jgi:hypothetical protein
MGEHFVVDGLGASPAFHHCTVSSNRDNSNAGRSTIFTSKSTLGGKCPNLEVGSEAAWTVEMDARIGVNRHPKLIAGGVGPR